MTFSLMSMIMRTTSSRPHRLLTPRTNASDQCIRPRPRLRHGSVDPRALGSLPGLMILHSLAPSILSGTFRPCLHDVVPARRTRPDCKSGDHDGRPSKHSKCDLTLHPPCHQTPARARLQQLADCSFGFRISRTDYMTLYVTRPAEREYHQSIKNAPKIFKK